jgi:ribosomal 50S subunit-associated protein YjgA (DUF615 family)
MVVAISISSKKKQLRRVFKELRELSESLYQQQEVNVNKVPL